MVSHHVVHIYGQSVERSPMFSVGSKGTHGPSARRKVRELGDLRIIRVGNAVA